MAEILGCGEADLLHRSAFDFVFPEDFEAAHQLMQQRQQGQHDELDFRYRRLDGSEVWLHVNATPVLDERGHYAGALGLFTDIPQRRHAERALQEQREWFEVTLASIGDAVIATDTAGQVTFLNSMAVALTGWPADAARGQPLETVFRILQEKTRQPAENPVTKALREGTVVGLANHTILVAKDGSECPIDDSAAPIKDSKGQTIGVVLIFRDVTERRRAEETRLRLAAIVESSEDAIVSKGLDGTIISWNAGAERVYGYTAAEMVGKPFSLLVPPDRTDEVQDSLRHLQQGERLDHFETTRLRKDGTLIDVSVSYSPVKDQEGHLVGTAVITRDITQRKRAEEALRARERQLELVTNNAPVLITHCDTQRRFKFVNKAYAERFGLHPRDLVGKHFAEIMGPEAYAAIAPFVDKVLSGQPVNFEIEVPYRTLGTQYMQCAYQPELDGQGRVIGFVAALQNVTEAKRIERSLLEEARTTETLYRISQALAAELELQQIVQIVTDEATQLTGADFGAFFYNVLDEQGEAYTLYTIAGVPREKFAQFPMPRNTAIFEPTFRGKGVVRLDDVTQDPRYGQNAPHRGMPQGHLPVRSYLAVPVVSRSGEVLGGLFFGHAQVGVFTERHERLVVSIAAQAAVAIDSARLYKQARESEARLAAIINYSPAIIFLKDLQGRYLLVNRRFEEYAQASGIPGPYVGKTDAEILPARMADQFRADDLEVIQTKQVKVYEETTEFEGKKRIGLTTKFPLLNEAGEVYAVCGINLDITERMQAEAALRDSEERLRLALEAGHMGVWDWNLRTNAITWSDNLEPIHGYAPGTFGGTLEAFQNLIHPADRELVNQAVARALQEQSAYDIEFRNLWPDGSVHWMAGKGKTFLEQGQPVRMVGIGMDITDRKRTEQDIRFLADASATLAGLVDYESTLQKVARLAVPTFADWCAVDMLDDKGALRRVAVAHVDPSRVELAHELHRRFPPDPTAPQGVWNIVRTGKAEIVAEIRDELLTSSVKDPELLKIMRELGLRSYMGVPLRIRGKVLGVITFIAAESGRRYGPRDLSVAEDLANRAAVAIENARLYQEVREADRRKDEFLATLAHELRNPLAPIRNALHVLKMSGITEGMLGQARDMAERQVHHLTRLVDDLLDVSRIMRGKIELRRERVDLGTIVTRAIETARPVIDAEGHELTVTLPPDPLWLEADLVRLSQVVANLLTNAARYTESKGHIWVTAGTEGQEAVIRVRDTGIGIAPEMLPRIFDMFTQAGSIGSRSQSGLGIGLTLVRSLVELHGGRVEAHSQGLGQGAEFIVRLPLASVNRHVETTTQGATSTVPPQTRRILVVDDNVDAADSLAMLLRLEGHEVQVAHDGPTALRLAEAQPPEIAFLDIGMPVMSGHDLARRFRENAALGHILLVAMTGWGQDQDRRRTKEAGFDHHLVKPVELEALHRVLAAGTS
jgi:PAS domain S-box-containing protein